MIYSQNTFLRILPFVFFLFSSAFFSQNTKKQEIEYRIKEIGNIIKTDKYTETKVVSLYKDLYQASKEVENKHGMIVALTALAVIYSNKSDTNECMKVVEKGLILAKDLGDHTRYATLLECKGRSLLLTENYSDARLSFSKALKAADLMKNKDSMFAIKTIIYNDLSNYMTAYDLKYQNTEYNDSILYFAKKSYAESIKLTGRIKGSNLVVGQSASLLGSIYSKLGNKEKSKQYFDKAEKILSGDSDKRFLANLYVFIGRTEFDYGNDNSALVYYQKALELSKDFNYPDVEVTIYDFFIKYYKKTGNLKQELYFTEKGKRLNDSLYHINQEALITQHKIDVNSINKSYEVNKNISLAISLLLILALLLLGLKYFLQKRKYKTISYKESQQQNSLKKQIESEKIAMLLELAKQNDNHFFLTFQEEFQELYLELLKFTMLTHADLELCAYLKLNLQTKEIALFKRISVGAVDNRKYRIRKKLGLLPEADLYKWINTIHFSNS